MVVSHCLEWQSISCVAHIARDGVMVSNGCRHESGNRGAEKGSTQEIGKVSNSAGAVGVRT